MKHSKLRLVIGMLLIAVAMFSVMVPVSAEDTAPVHFISFDDEYYHDAIGNAYGFTDVDYIDVTDNDKIKGAVRLTLEKSPYEHMGTYDKDGYHGVFDPYFYMPLYEIEEDIKCGDIKSVVVYARLQKEGGADFESVLEKPVMYVGTDVDPVITGAGDFIQANSGFAKNSSEWTKIQFNIKKSLTAWDGNLQILRIDPLSQANDAIDYIDVAGVAFFDSTSDAKAFAGDFAGLKAGEKKTAESSFAFGTAIACVVAAFGINGDLLKKKKVRAILAICLIAVMAIGVVGCGKSEEKSKDETNAQTSTPGCVTTAPSTATPSVDDNTAIEDEKLVSSGANAEYKYELYETYAKVTRYIGTAAEVTIPDTIEGLPVKVIGYKAMFRQYNLKDNTIGVTKLTLPDSVEIIEDYAFAGLEEATEINFGKNLKSIGSNSVENCYSLTKVTFAGTDLTKIDSWAFSGCRVLEEITLPDSVVEIGNAAFQFCNALSGDKLTIPASVTTQGKGITFACTPLPEGVTPFG